MLRICDQMKQEAPYFIFPELLDGAAFKKVGPALLMRHFKPSVLSQSPALDDRIIAKLSAYLIGGALCLFAYARARIQQVA